MNKKNIYSADSEIKNDFYINIIQNACSTVIVSNMVSQSTRFNQIVSRSKSLKFILDFKI